MKPSPVIIVSTMSERKGAEFSDWSTSLSHWYTRAIAKAGGVPLLAPNLPEKNLARDMVARADGVMLTGGDDLQPDLYDANLPKHIKAKAGGVDPARDLFELYLITETLKQRKPLLAICRGPQVLNIALGGGLVTDIPTERPKAMNHQIKGKAHKLAHTIEIEPDTLMRRIFRRATLRINSAHHQAVGELAPMLRATAWTRDGIVEAIELSQKDAEGAPFLLGVQFHPERLIDEHGEFLRIFKAFVKACRA
jgi:putative glutamine amidotransferase